MHEALSVWLGFCDMSSRLLSYQYFVLLCPAWSMVIHWVGLGTGLLGVSYLIGRIHKVWLVHWLGFGLFSFRVTIIYTQCCYKNLEKSQEI